jgi:rhodanese-related sulfurtransferase
MDGEIEPDALAALLEEGDPARIVDIRPPRAFRTGHIPDSENVPLARLVDDVETFAGSDHVVTVCPHGQASVKAARLIAAYGEFDGRVESLRGGLDAWAGPLTEPGSGRDAGGAGGEESTAPF